MEKQSREQVYNTFREDIEIMKSKKSELIYETHKHKVKTLADMAVLQEMISEDDILTFNSDLLVDIGIDTWQKLDDEYNRIQENEIHYEDKENNAIVHIWSLVDLIYSEQTNPILDYGDE